MAENEQARAWEVEAFTDTRVWWQMGVFRSRWVAEHEADYWKGRGITIRLTPLCARPTASEEAIEAAARDLVTNYPGETSERTVVSVLRRHFGASDTGGEG